MVFGEVRGRHVPCEFRRESVTVPAPDLIRQFVSDLRETPEPERSANLACLLTGVRMIGGGAGLAFLKQLTDSLPLADRQFYESVLRCVSVSDLEQAEATRAAISGVSPRQGKES